MARKTTILGQNRVSYSKAIREITGWTQKEFETQKRLMRQRVSKFNQLTGSNLSAIEQLFYRVRYEDKKKYYESKGKPIKPLNPLQQALEDMKTSRLPKSTSLKIENGKIVPATSKGFDRVYSIAKDFIENRYEGLANNFPRAREILNRLKNDEITPAEANELLADFADEMRNAKSDDPLGWQEAHGDFEIGSPL